MPSNYEEHRSSSSRSMMNEYRMLRKEAENERKEDKKKKIRQVVHRAAGALRSNNQNEDDLDRDHAYYRSAKNTSSPVLNAKKHKSNEVDSVDQQVIDRRWDLNTNQHSNPAKKTNKHEGTYRNQLTLEQLKLLPEIQRRLLQCTITGTSAHPRSKKKAVITKKTGANLDRIFNLSKPKKKDTMNNSKKVFASFDDMENCTFQPEIAEPKKSSDDGNGYRRQDDKESNNAIARMEAIERARKLKLAQRREEAKYQSKQNKKVCPQCDTEQSYTEVVQKRMKCENCQERYQVKTSWNLIGSDFFDRVDQASVKQQEKRQQLEHKYACPFRLDSKTVYDSKTKTMMQIHLRKKYWNEVEEEFITRMKNDMIQREMKKEELKQQGFGLSKECTFAPQLLSSSKKYQFEPFLERMAQDVEKRQQQRHEEHISTQKEDHDGEEEM